MEIEKIRQSYKPDNIKILFVGESAPASGDFFYKGDSLTTHTQKAFEKAFHYHYASYQDFLSSFEEKGCYLDDLSLIPVNHMTKKGREATLKKGITPLSKRLDEYSPEKIIVVMKKIKKYVFEAIGKSKLDDIHIQVLTYPGYKKKNIDNYVDELAELLKNFFKTWS